MPYEYDDIELDFEQRQRSLALGPQVVEDTDWACDSIIWQRDRIAELESKLAAETERADRAEKVAVDSARKTRRVIGTYVWDVENGYIEHDGTDADILRALFQAMEGE